MRVLTTTLCYPTASHPEQGLFVQRRAVALAKQSDIEVHALVPQPWCPILRHNQLTENQQVPLLATFPKMISIPVLGWATDGLGFARAIEKTLAVQKTDIDLIDAHFVYPDGVGAWLAGRRLGIPVVVTVRGKIVSLSRRAIRRAQIRAMLRGVDARIAVSDSLAAWVHKVAGTDLPVEVIPNGVDTNVYHCVNRDQARSALGWDHNIKYILSVGHLQKVKGFDRLVSAMPAIRAAWGDVRLVLAGSRRGERSFSRKLENLVAQSNHQANPHKSYITFTGPLPSKTLNLMYNAADLTVNSSRSEGWCNAISESLAVGTPVVATDVGGNREQICSGELGAVVPDGDKAALTKAIISALSGEWNKPLIAAHGSARTWNQVADEVRTVFARVLQSRTCIVNKEAAITAGTEPAERLPAMEALTEVWR